MGTAIHPSSNTGHDWRVWAGRLGRLLIGTGLLLLAFVAYQLWGTGLQQDRAQDRLADRFADLSAQVAATSTTPTSTTPSSTTPSDTTPNDTTPNDTTPNDTTPNDTTSSDTTPATPTAPLAGWTIAPGDPIGVIEIPRLDVREFVVAGVAAADLRKGPGHFPLTPLPGELGNAAIAGHRTTYGEPFAALDQLQTGDEIVMEMLGGGRYVYSVDSSRIVSPSDVDVVATTDPDVARLTLTTCHPRWSAAQRLVVSGVLVEESSATPGEQPIVVSDDPSVVGGPSDGDALDPGVDSDSGRDDIVATDTADAFDAGWFSDPAAWPHVVAWSMAVLVLGWAIWWIGRRATMRRRAAGRRMPSIARLVTVGLGALPFLVCLYFAFENLSRLLPPNL